MAALLGSAPAGAAPPTVVELRVSGVVDPFVASYVQAGIRAAEADGAAAVLLTIDTPGGLDSSMRTIVQAIVNSRVPVIGYVSPSGARAASAGTFILLACPVAAMAPGTNVGAAHPVGVSGAIEQDKVLNDAAAYIQGLAELRHRNSQWARDAVVNSISASAEEALRIDVVDLVAPDTRALFDQLQGREVAVAGERTVRLDLAGATIVARKLGLGATILHGLLSPNLAFIFFYLGIGLIIAELLHPGLSIPGILGVLSLVGSFVSFGVLPVQLIGVVFLLASAGFLLLELKHPGFGVPSVGGILSLVAGGLLLFNPSVPNARVSPWVIAPVAGVLVAFFALVVPAALRVRHLPAAGDVPRLLGAEGTVTTALDPEGVVQVQSESWTAASVGGTLAKGTNVRVVEVDGLRLKVEPVGREQEKERQR